jgi:hypothetical protein
MGDISAAASIIGGIVTLLIAVYQFSATYFHVAYLLTLAFLSVHLVISTMFEKNRFAMVTAITVMVCFGLLSVVKLPYPILEVDVNFELQNVNHILSAGVAQMGQGTGYASEYSYFPGLEILVSIVSLVSHIPQVVLLKYGGSFVSAITVLFLYCAYSTIQSTGLVAQRQVCGLAAALAALTPWFVAFDAFMNHPTLALVFLGMALFAWSQPRRIKWTLVALLGVTGVAITNVTTSYVLISLLLVMGVTALLFGKKNLGAGLPNLTNITGAITVVVLVAWSIFLAINYLPVILSYFGSITNELFSPRPTLAPVSVSLSKGVKPLWVVALTYVGFATYFVLTFGMLVRGMLRKNAQNRTTVWLAFSGLLIFGGFVAPFLAGVTVGIDLMGRGLMYFYFFTALLVAQFLGWQLIGAVHKSATFRFSKRTVLAVGLIFIILVPSVYYGVPPSTYDRSSPIVFNDDSRLSLGEWQVVAGFSRDRVSDNVVWGVRLAFEYVDALGGKQVWLVSVPVGSTLFGWFQQRPRQLVFLRLSMTHTGDAEYVSEIDLLSTLNHANILYSSGDVVILEYP